MAGVCRSGPMPWISLMMVQVLVSTTMMPLCAGEGCRMERYSFELSIENTMWNGLGYLPRHRGSSTCATLRQFVGSGSAQLKIEQLFSRRLFIITRNLPSGEKPISWPGELILSKVTVQVSLPAGTTGY